eukprot:811306-Rhodomonas_salina.1
MECRPKSSTTCTGLTSRPCPPYPTPSPLSLSLCASVCLSSVSGCLFLFATSSLLRSTRPHPSLSLLPRVSSSSVCLAFPRSILRRKDLWVERGPGRCAGRCGIERGGEEGLEGRGGGRGGGSGKTVSREGRRGDWEEGFVEAG